VSRPVTEQFDTAVSVCRYNWRPDEVKLLFDLPFNDLIYHAHRAHRSHFNPNELQLSTLLNIKSGGCPEDCGYCPQSVHYETDAEVTPLMDGGSVLAAAKQAQAQGATRFCMGAAWRSPKPRDLQKVSELVRIVKELGMETCATLGMLDEEQAVTLKAAGLDFYNHNIDTSPEYYGEIITTRDFEDRLRTLQAVRKAEIKVCCGGIIGMGESASDRISMLLTLANMDPHPESVPINLLVKVEGTPLAKAQEISGLDMVKIIAVARLMMPKSYLRLSAGRTQMSSELQALCFFAGANSVFYGEKLLTTGNPDTVRDRKLFNELGMVMAR
jgi:biotin synthase